MVVSSMPASTMETPAVGLTARRDLIAVVGIGVIIAAAAALLDVFHLVLEWSVRHDPMTVEEAVLVSLILLGGLSVFALRRWREATREIVRRARLEATLRDQATRLEEALGQVKTLRGLVPVCAWCSKRIRDEQGAWIDRGLYLRDRTEAQVTHGICPECKAGVRASMRPR